MFYGLSLFDIVFFVVSGALLGFLFWLFMVIMTRLLGGRGW